jgi:hypothetical protein
VEESWIRNSIDTNDGLLSLLRPEFYQATVKLVVSMALGMNVSNSIAYTPSQ